MPQKLAGLIIDAPVWVPNAMGIIPVATAIAEPLELVPGLLVASYGFNDFPKASTANYAVSVFPAIIPLFILT